MIRRPPDVHGAAFDLLVVGGSLFACALAREAATSGLRTMLVAPGDPGAGARPRGWLGGVLGGALATPLMASALAEREALLRDAPHRVRPIRALVVDASPAARPDGARRRLERIAALTPRSTLPPAQRIAAEEAQRRWPGLPTEPAAGAALAFDALLDEAGLARSLVRGAIAAGAVVWPHADLPQVGVDGIALRAAWCERRAVVRATTTVAAEAFEAVASAFHVDVRGRMRRSDEVAIALPDRSLDLARVALGASSALAAAPGRGDAVAWWGGPGDDDAFVACQRDVPGLQLAPTTRHAVLPVFAPAEAIEEATVAGKLLLKAPSPLRAMAAARAALQRLAPDAVGAAAAPIPGGLGPRSPLSPLWQRHGGDAATILRRAGASAELRAVVCPHREALAAEVEFAIQDDGATCFADVVRRLFGDGVCADPQCVRRAHAVYARLAGDVPDADAARAVADARAALATVSIEAC